MDRERCLYAIATKPFQHQHKHTHTPRTNMLLQELLETRKELVATKARLARARQQNAANKISLQVFVSVLIVAVVVVELVVVVVGSG